MGKQLFYFYRLCHTVHFAKHFFLCHAVIFQHKSNIFRNRQTDKLPVRILQHGSNHLGKPKNPKFFRIFSLDSQRPGTISLIRKRDQSVDTI